VCGTDSENAAALHRRAPSCTGVADVALALANVSVCGRGDPTNTLDEDVKILAELGAPGALLEHLAKSRRVALRSVEPEAFSNQQVGVVLALLEQHYAYGDFTGIAFSKRI